MYYHINGFVGVKNGTAFRALDKLAYRVYYKKI